MRTAIEISEAIERELLSLFRRNYERIQPILQRRRARGDKVA